MTTPTALAAPPARWTEISVKDLVAAGLLVRGSRGYTRPAPDGGRLSVFVSREPDGWHLSISHSFRSQPGRYPTWDEIVEARYRFLPNDITVAQLLPPLEEYTNVHATTFHLWEVVE